MKDKYIRTIKRSFIILGVLLVAVCFLLGSSYSNFVYSLNNHRAVEMIVSGLNYKVKINNEEKNILEIKPGMNIFNIEIESLNKVDSYFKFLVNKDIDAFYVDEKLEGLIKENEKKNYFLVVFNNSSEEVISYYDVASGYINNELSDVIVPDKYKEIDNSFTRFSNIKLSDNNSNFKVLDFNGSKLEIIIDEPIVSNSIRGASGYIDYDETLNNLLLSFGNYNIRNVSLLDIERYTGNKLITFNEKEVFKDYYFYIPYKNERYYINDNKVLSSELKINNKIDSVFDEVFFNGDYTLSNTYSKENTNDIEWGVISIKEGKVMTSKLYDSNNHEYETSIILKPIIVFTNNVKIKYDKDNSVFIVKGE